jgi:hypothetical protein
MEKTLLFNLSNRLQSLTLTFVLLILLLFNTSGVVYGQVSGYPDASYRDFNNDKLNFDNPLTVLAQIYKNNLSLRVQTGAEYDYNDFLSGGNRYYVTRFELWINDKKMAEFDRTGISDAWDIIDKDPGFNIDWSSSRTGEYIDENSNINESDKYHTLNFQSTSIPRKYLKVKNKIEIKNVKIRKYENYFSDTYDFETGKDAEVYATYDTPIFMLSGVTATPGCGFSTVKWNSEAVTGQYEGLVFATINNNTHNYGTTSKEQTESVSIPSGSGDETMNLYLGADIIATTTVSVSPIDALPIPADLQASKDKCDGSVLLKWQWSQTSPSNFVVYKSVSKTGPFTKLSDVITGSKRSWPIIGLTRGQEYYFRIAASMSSPQPQGKCPGDGPQSEDEVTGISPANPILPTVATMELLTGTQSGVKLTWNEAQWTESDFKEPTGQKYIITRTNTANNVQTKIEIPIADLYADFVQNKIKGINGYTLSYTDGEVITCGTYSYKISAVNICSSTTPPTTKFIKSDATDKINIDFSDLKNVFKGKNLETSKGYYGNLVQLDWKADENADFVGVYKIYRRILGSTILPEMVQTLDKNARSWADNRSIPSTIYEYYIIAEADCGLDKLVSYNVSDIAGQTIAQLKGNVGLASGIGFRLPAATITGNITYVGGFAVPNVKVVAERDGVITGRALEFDGTSQYVKINPDAKEINYSKTGLSASLWIKPKQLTGTQMVSSLKDVFELKLEDNKLKVTIGNNQIESNSKLVADNYTHVFATCSADSLSLYINGKKDIGIKRTDTAALLEKSTAPIYLGDPTGTSNYKGLIDEFRVYSKAVTAADVQRDYSRLIASETPNLVGYWRFDEGVGPYVFDSSKESGVYHKNDGDLTGAKWSTEVPSKVQLGFGGFTDKNGNYVIEGILYNGTGENFSVTPTMTLSGSIHAFSPTNRILFLGEGKTTENNIDFTDQSSFEVTGSVRFNFDDKENDLTHFQSSGSEGVSIWIDGTQQAMKDGKAILTDNFGQFKVVVPIGKHFLEFKKDGHVFAEKQFPKADDKNKGTFDFQDRLSGIEVLDNTTHKLVGCVVGGLVQGNKKLGFLDYKGKLHTGVQRVNNIGKTYFTLTSTDTKIKRMVTTDPETGEFEIQLPPKEYELSDIQYLGNESDPGDDKVLLFKKDITSVKLSSEDAYKGHTETEEVLTAGVYTVKSVYYNTEKRLIYRTKPNVIVETPTGKNYLPNTYTKDASGNIVVAKTTVGEKAIKNLDKSTGKYIDIPTAELPFPLFQQGTNYQLTIKAVENYDYFGVKPDKNPTKDVVPVSDGEVTVSNNISAKAEGGNVAAYLKGDNTWGLLSGNTHMFPIIKDGKVDYSFMGGDPDLVKGQGPTDSFVKSMGVTFKTKDHTVYWPEENDASVTYKGYVMGGLKMPGTDFITVAPVEIQTTLRMPPGSGSSVTIEKGSSFTTEQTESTNAGGDWSFGIGPVLRTWSVVPLTGQVAAEVENKVMGTFYGSKYDGNEQTSVSTSSFSENFTITAADAFGKGDFYISTADNIEIGLANTMKFILVTNCVGCVGPKVKVEGDTEYVLDISESFYQKVQGQTKFLYSEDHIKTDIIPKMERVRNSLFVNQADLYTSNVAADKPLYGTNNDDPRWNDGKLDKDNNYTESGSKDDSGKSYVFNRANAPLVKGIKQDKVRWYNDQIRAWREIIMNNEIEKWSAINETKPEKENISISSGIAYTNTSSVEKEEIRVQSSEVMVGASLDIETGFAVFGVGVSVAAHGGGDKTFGSSSSNSNVKSVTTSYTIQDNDAYNVYSLNVYKGKGNDSPIFQVVAGQTSCPFEAEKELDVTKDHTYYLQYWIDKLPSLISENISNPEKLLLLTAKKETYEKLLAVFDADKTPLLGVRTVQIEKPGILVNGNDKAIMRNVPSSKAAVFDLELRNETELKPSSPSDEIEYQLSVDPASNPDGLVVLLNGETLVKPVAIAIPFGQKMRQTLTVLRGPKLYDYKDLTLIFESACDTAIHKEVKMDIQYIPVCAEAAIASPGNNWTVNYDSKNKLALKVDGYDVNYQGFKGIKIQYKKSNESDSDWRLLKTYYRDVDSRTKAIADLKEDDKNAPVLAGNDFVYNWDVTKLPDDLYDVRIQSMCQGESDDVIFTSPTVSGIIDRVNPSSFGAPQPSDGVLSAGDEIMLQFNEPINAGLLSPYNFDIRGVIQGGELRHPASLYFNGTHDYMEIPAGIQLNRRSFSFDFYAKRKKQGAETLLSQGTTTAQSFSAGFNATNQFEVVLAGVKINSAKTIPADDTWVHCAYAYDANNQEAKLYINGVLDVIKQNYTPNYEATGKIVVAKDGLSQNPSFQGNMHELRFWGKSLSEAQVNVAATKRMKNNEPGLLGNWPMEESEGKLAQDIVRERHAQIVSGTWQVALSGNALSTTAVNETKISSPAYLDVSNFSVEFWFKGNNTTQATLLSNGRGDDQDLNINGWSVRANATGLLEVWNNNKLFKASDNNYFDNQWHHFALVVNRLTNTVCYVDGNQQNTTESTTTGFSGFGGESLHLGAMGWIANDGTPNRIQPFEGALDEIRIWQGARNALQIKRDMRYMLKGDEPGLDLYLPFDKYKTTMGIEMLEASTTSAATGLTAVKNSGMAADVKGTLAYMQNTPLVKLPRPVRKVNFSYSANQDKIILTSTDTDSMLENVILDISVTNVQDLNGNTMKAPVNWTAYIDKNQVVWTESDKHFEIETGKGFTFETRIKNTGGKVYNYNINNLPAWLTASPSSGVLSPVSSAPIVFTVDKDVNIGNYVQDILLETEFGFAEVMNLSLDVSKQLPADWKVTPSNYQYSMNFIAQLNINGDVSRDPNDQVAAFVGDECRGIAKLRYIEALDNYQAYISVYSNKTAGEAIQFRIWNASDGQVHRDVTPTYLFESNDVKGTASKPEMLKAVDVLEHTYDLPKGWTWISAHLNYNYNPNKQLKTNDLLKPLKATNGDLIRTIDAVDSYDKQEGWAGTLTAKGGIANGRGYKIFLTEENQLKYNGLLLKGDQVKIDLVKGWNWIGYIGFKNTPINQALAGFANAKEGDIIKNQYSLAIYNQNVGWLGDLTSLKPGEGYMMKTAQAGSFHYPNLSYTASGSKINSGSKAKSVIIAASSKYPNSMNAVAEVVGDNQSNNNRLRAFVGKELRGEAIPTYNPITKKTAYFVTVYGQNTPEDIRFEFVDEQLNATAVNETYSFATDVVLGDLKTPKVLTLASGQDQLESVLVYPNPFTNVLTVQLYVGHMVAKVTLTDMLGRKVKTVDVAPSQLNLVWDVRNLSSAVYILSTYDTEGNVLESKRVIK